MSGRRLSHVFDACAQQGRAALIVYVTAGLPELATTAETLVAAARAGADVIEVGYPFSDPMADGPTLQKAHHEALSRAARRGTPITLERVFEQVRRARAILGADAPPMVLMSYYNPLFTAGLGVFLRSALEAGLEGAIVPDLPLDEAGPLTEARQALSSPFHQIFLLAPTSTRPRIARVASQASGFVYLVSLTGVTGARRSLPENLADFVQRVRLDLPHVPLAVGFGIASPDQAAAVGELAEGVVVGSALMQCLLEEGVGAMARRIQALRAALEGGRR